MGNDNYEDLVKCGYLEMKLPRKHRKFGRQAWKHKWFILRRKSSQQGYPRLEYFKSEEACFEMKNKTVVDLSALQAIEESNKSKTRKYTFKLAFTDTFIYIASALDNNMKEWVRLIKKLVLPKQNPTIYIPRPEGSYLVTTIQTDDSERLNLVGDYILTVTDEHLILYRADCKFHGSTSVAQWDLDDIPRFRLQKLHQLNDCEKIFIFNLARTSQNAEGEFQFLTKDGRPILETVKSHTKKRIQNTDDSRHSSPVEDLVVSHSTISNEGDRSRTSSVQSHMTNESDESDSSSAADTTCDSVASQTRKIESESLIETIDSDGKLMR